MGIKKNFRRVSCCVALTLMTVLPSHGQGGKEFLQWLKEYSPTGFFIINDYETRANKPGEHKEFIVSTTAPVSGTPVHEMCHALNGFNSGSSGGKFAYFVGGIKTLVVTPGFKVFTCDKMVGEIPPSLTTSRVDLYLKDPQAFANVFGLYGLFEEWSAYNADLKSAVDMMPCFKANFNTETNINALAGDVHFTTTAVVEFRYFCLRYMLYAKKAYPTDYANLLGNKDTKAIYAALAAYSQKTADEWKAVTEAMNRDTKDSYGWKEHWMFQTELKKQEYKDMEALLLNGVVAIAPSLPLPSAGLAPFYGTKVTVGVYSMRGESMHTATLRAMDARAYQGLWMDLSLRYGGDGHVLRISNGKDIITGPISQLRFPTP